MDEVCFPSGPISLFSIHTPNMENSSWSDVRIASFTDSKSAIPSLACDVSPCRFPEQEENSASNVESMMKNLFIDTSVSATQFRIAKIVVFRQCATFTQKFTQKLQS